MTFQELAPVLKANMQSIEALYAGVGDVQMRWRPADDRWSLLEVLGHLLDEEKADFKQALKNLIADPTLPWPDISPFEWVESRSYNTKDPAATIMAYKEERSSSLQWLAESASPDSELVHQGKHPFHRAMKTGDIAASWIAHDYFHIRQITNVKWEYLMKSAAPYECWYAGEY